MATDLAELGEDFLDTLLAASPSAAREVVERALDSGVSPDRLYLDVITPALHEVGRRWQDGQVSIAREHLATATTQSLMAELAPRMRRDPRSAGRALVASVDGDQHVVGARMVADFLEARGWEVYFLGASTPPMALRAFAEDIRPAIVALSVTIPGNLRAAADAIDALRTLEPSPFVAVGGWALKAPESVILRDRADLATADVDVFIAAVASRAGRQ